MPNETLPPDWVPDSCTLPTAEQPLRVAEFDEFFAIAVHQTERPRTTRLSLRFDAAAEPKARDLTAREISCCSFFTFSFEAGPVLHIDVPATQVAVLDAIEARARAAIDAVP